MNPEAYLAELQRTGVSGYIRIFDHAGVRLDEGLGFANRQTGTLNTSTIVFDIASIAKTFTAAAILHLHDVQLLDLQDVLLTYFPDVPIDKQTITIHHLITHTSGLTRYISDNDFEPVGKEEVIARALQAPLRAEPGSQEQYGEANYALLAAIIERVGKTSFTDYVRTHLLIPVGLNNTGWYGDSHLQHIHIAMGYLGEQPVGNPATWPLTWALLGAGGMLSTVDDLTRWLQAISTPGIMSEATHRLLTYRPYKKWAGGWEVHDKDFGHLVLKGGNSEFGFAGAIGYIPEQQSGIVLLLNGRPNGSDGIHHEIVAKLLPMYFSSQ